MCVCSVISDSLRRFGLWPARLCPWDFSGKNTGVVCHFLLQRIFLTQGSNLCFLCLLHCSRFFTSWANSIHLLNHRRNLKYFSSIHFLPLSMWLLSSLFKIIPQINLWFLQVNVVTNFFAYNAFIHDVFVLDSISFL